MSQHKTVSIKVIGKVQGVFFRQHTYEKACELGITGFVRNDSDGSVHITACGPVECIDEFAHWCHTGSPDAEVTHVHLHELPEPLQAYSTFVIER